MCVLPLAPGNPAALLLILILVLVWPQPGPLCAQVIVNEVLAAPERDWDGDGLVSFMGDEWIEVKNMGYEVEDLSFYFLRDAHQETIHLQLEGLLRGGEAKVFHGSDALTWQRACGLAEVGFALNNFGETVQLLRLSAPSPEATLEVVFTVTLLAHETVADRSSGWTEEGGGWLLYDAWNPYDGSLVPEATGCAPTPGDLNICRPLTPVRRTTWTALKACYR